ncbi:MAG: glycosyltransferase family 2 protein [Betaproteobacteria bacterium]|nr:glycosyltransferase family 2 protein [Betaproteobacteria bacterium]
MSRAPAGKATVRAEAPAKISLIIPVFNEATHLRRFLEEIDRIRLPLSCELVIVNDGSGDESSEIVRRFPFVSQIQFVELHSNGGKGAAVTAGIQRVTGSIIGIQDADFEYRFDDIARLVEPIIEDRADVVYGSRFRNGGFHAPRTLHYLANRALTLMSNFASGVFLSDMETCYKFFRAEVIQNINLESRRFGIEPEITAKIARLKLRISELPISYFPRRYAEGKKITWRDGVAAIWHILYFNFLDDRKRWFRKELPLEFTSPGKF